MPFHGKMGEKVLKVFPGKGFWGLKFGKFPKTAYPIKIGLFRAVRIVFPP